MHNSVNLTYSCLPNLTRTITFLLLQLQFFIVTIHNSQFLFMKCSYPWKYVAFIQGFTTIVAILFLNFYIKTYRRNPRHSAKKTDTMSVSNGHNGYHANGYVIANGNSNGHISNGFLKVDNKDLRRKKLYS